MSHLEFPCLWQAENFQYYTHGKSERSSGLRQAIEPIINPRLRMLLGGGLALCMLGACYSALRLAYADHLAQTESADQVQRAVMIAPDNANYWLHWADLQEAAGRSGGPGITRAVEADPFNAEVWIRAGLNAEMRGDFEHAEQYLLRAARQSAQFEPRWTLANYYFRRNDDEHFWPWARSAIIWAQEDPTLLFELLWRTRADPDTIVSRAIPDDGKVLRAYLGFLLHNDRSDAAQAVARKLEPRVSAEDRDVLLRYTDYMLNKRCWQAALSSWNALCLRKVLPYDPLIPGHGQLINDATFTAGPLNSGFDWRIPRVDGVATIRDDSPPSLRIDFSGEQPESCELINQFVPLEAPGKYKLRFTYRTEGVAPQTGLRWRIIDPSTQTELPAQGIDLASDHWTEAATSFVVPPGLQSARVMLTYRRSPGTVRIEGSVWLRHVDLESAK
jgi:tetratricopeptide (TPR) repeat protein